MCLFHTIFEIKGNMSKFSHPNKFNTPLRGFPLEFCNDCGLEKKTRIMTYQSVRKCGDMSIRSETIVALDRQMDGGRTALVKQYRTLHALHADK